MHRTFFGDVLEFLNLFCYVGRPITVKVGGGIFQVEHFQYDIKFTTFYCAKFYDS